MQMTPQQQALHDYYTARKKCLLYAILIPVGMLLVDWYFLSHLMGNQKDFESVEFIPHKMELKLRSFRIYHADGTCFVYRKPDTEAITEIFCRIPHREPLQILFSRMFSGNVIVQIRELGDQRRIILDLKEVVRESRYKSKTIRVVAGLWFLLFIVWFFVIAPRQVDGRDGEVCDPFS